MQEILCEGLSASEAQLDSIFPSEIGNGKYVGNAWKITLEQGGRRHSPGLDPPCPQRGQGPGCPARTSPSCLPLPRSRRCFYTSSCSSIPKMLRCSPAGDGCRNMAKAACSSWPGGATPPSPESSFPYSKQSRKTERQFLFVTVPIPGAEASHIVGSVGRSLVHTFTG